MGHSGVKLRTPRSIQMPGERGGSLVISVVRRQDQRFCGEPVRLAKLVSSELE